MYLNLVIDSSGPACINMLNRFFNTLVLQNDCISGNGGAFISEETQSFIKNGNIKWTFNKQVPPWTGGVF